MKRKKKYKNPVRRKRSTNFMRRVYRTLITLYRRYGTKQRSAAQVAVDIKTPNLGRTQLYFSNIEKATRFLRIVKRFASYGIIIGNIMYKRTASARGQRL